MSMLIAAMVSLLGALGSPRAQEQQDGVPWLAWVIIILLLALAVWFLWSWYTSRQKSGQPGDAAPSATKTPEQPASPVPASMPVAAAVAPLPVKPDDLTVIEGIGPKIASVLQAAGIATFSQLAQADSKQLEQILEKADLRLANPHTWPEQASLAGAGKWDELKVLQDGLKGGRRA